LRTGRPGYAIQLCVDGVIIAPRNASLRRLLGASYSAMGMTKEATAVYRNWVQAEPDNPVALFHLQACTGESVPDRAPDAYVTSIFDSFASSFDAKLGSLSYQAPQLVAAALARHAGPPARALDMLDAGCGTGLCGPLLREYARRLDGVDLSPRMLGQAELRADYDSLVCGELVAFLRARPGAYDAIVSADTLCYFGALEAFAAAAFAGLGGGGLLVFTVEVHTDDDGAPDFWLREHGRYSHRRRYVETALKGAGFMAVELESVVLRMEARKPVEGLLVSTRTPRPR
jgi:predicted TPR repeat methyltransferase